MTYLLGLPADTGSDELLAFEVDRSEVPDDLVLASPSPGEVVAKAEITVEQSLAKLKPSLQKLARMLKELAPDEAEVEFGLKIGGETGVIIARGTGEVNFAIRMTWKGDQQA